MRSLWRKISALVVSVFLMVMPLAGNFLVTGPVFAEDKPPETSVLPDDWVDKGDGTGINKMLQFVLSFVVYGLGAAAILGLVIVGIQYMTARDNEAQMTKAKTRLIEIVIGLVAWGIMYAALNFLIPGGLAGTGSGN